MANEEEVIVDTNEEVEVTEEPKEEAKVEKPKRTPEEELAYYEGRAKRLRKDLGVEIPEKPKNEAPKTGELDNTQLDYLDLKGITEDEDIAVIKSIMSKTGQTVREVLKDDYVVSKLNDLKKAREVKSATPSSTKRAGQQATDNEDYWAQKYEASGELPKGMPKGMAAKLVARRANAEDPRKNPYER